MPRLVSILAAVLTCGVIALSADLFRRAGLVLYTEQYLAALLTIALPLLYLHVPAGGEKKRSGPVPWYDLLAAIVAFAAAAYVAVRFPALSELVSRRPWDGLAAAAILLLLFIEGLRRTSGLPLVITTMYYGCLSMITPPVAIAAFAAANLAGADPMRTGFEAMRLGWTVFVIPFLIVFSGTLLMQGGLAMVAVDFAAAVAGVWFFSASPWGRRRTRTILARVLRSSTML